MIKNLYTFRIVVLLLSGGGIALLSYFSGMFLGYQNGREFVNKTYFEEAYQDLGDLLDHTKYLATVKGTVTNITGDIVELTKDGQKVSVTLSNKAVFIKGPANNPQQLSQASLSDIKVGTDIRLSAYLQGQNLISYQIFVYE